MRKSTLVWACLGIFLSGTLYAQEWEQATGLENNTRHHPVTWSLNGYGYAVTGSSASEQNGSDSFFRYDPDTDSWEQLDDFPGQDRSYSIGGMYEGKGYLGFGSFGGTDLNDLWVYDPDTEDWQELSPCPCTGRNHPTFTINEEYGKIYVGKGNRSNGVHFKDWWEYDIATDTWEEKTDFPGTPRHHPYHFSIGEYTYTGFGHDASPGMAREDWYRYNPDDDSWEQMADAPDGNGRIAGQQFKYDGQGFVIDGDGINHAPSNPSIFWKYDPVTDSWEELEPHPGYSLWAPGSFVIENTLYFFGGVNKVTSTFFQDMWTTNLDEVLNAQSFAEGTFNVYPNPANDYLHITSTIPLENGVFELYSIEGKLLLKHPVEERINVSQLASGLYLLKLSDTNGNSKTVRFVKQ